jgi:hypothetical protein
MKRILTAVCAGIAITSSATAATAQDVFRHLKASEIKRTISGKVITDGPTGPTNSHRTVPSNPSCGQAEGALECTCGSNLCLAYPSAKAESVSSVWRYGQMIEYRRDGVLLAQGKLVIQ